ncbi:MAG: GPR endopeptidase [Clostridia bacterium]|nr:GPR endopeptidase [Clostridia bacterium]
MKEYTRTDLALEKKTSSKDGTIAELCREERVGEAMISEIALKKEGAEDRYVTVSRERLWDADGTDFDELTTLIALEIRKIARRVSGKEPNTDFGVLIAGLGNSEITADAIGPLTVKNLTVTRHLREFEPSLYTKLGTCEISAFAPGVLGQTGIETAELILGAVQNSKPDIVIAVDALAARSCERLASIVQISDAGISPGSGIGNTRRAITEESLGVPVISIGVPTVVNSSTLVYDALEKAGIEKIDKDLESVLETGRSFFVTPKESDVITKHISALLAESISKAFSAI